MSHHPVASRSLDDLQLTATAKAAVLRIARKIAGGFVGEVQLIILKGGGIRSCKWIESETGDMILEELD